MTKKENSRTISVGTHLSSDEKDEFKQILTEEREKYKKVLPDVDPNKIVNESSYMRNLLLEDFKRRRRQNNQRNKSRTHKS